MVGPSYRRPLLKMIPTRHPWLVPDIVGLYLVLFLPDIHGWSVILYQFDSLCGHFDLQLINVLEVIMLEILLQFNNIYLVQTSEPKQSK